MSKTSPNCCEQSATQRLTLTGGAMGNESQRVNNRTIMVASEITTHSLIQNLTWGNRRKRRQAKKMLRRKARK